MAVVALIVASLIPPSVHVAKADDDASAASVTPTAYAANYGQLVSAINGSQSAVIAITGNIAFTGQITLNQSKKITLVSDASACGTACELTYASASDFSLFNVIGDSSLTFGGGTEDTNKLSFSNHLNGRLVQVGSASDKGTVTINGGTYNKNGSDSNTTGDGNIAYVFANGNLTINGGDFKNNFVFHAGDSPTIGVSRSGGAVVRSSGSVTINGGTFSGNSTGANTNKNVNFHGGGAIWSDGMLIVNDGEFTANVSNAVHYTNSSKHPTGGGAIWAAGRLVVNGGTFQDNWQMDNTTLYATGGGAIYFGDGTQNKKYNGSMVINGGTFDSNRSMQDGGAIFMAWNCEAVFQQGEFRNNWSNRLGGAVYTEEDSVSYVTNAVAYENYAGHFGGGLWLCPSGKGVTSEHGGMALFDNEANTRYDRTETGAEITQDTIDGKNYGYSGSQNRGVSGAGDDFSIMYPSKSRQTNYFQLSVEWFTGDRVTWHDDGEPSQSANGYLYGVSDLSVNSMKRLTEGNEYTSDVTLDPGPTNKIYHGYGLKVTKFGSDQAKQNAKDAFITFTKNTARLSGGAFGSNGTVDFVKVYNVSWNKISSESSNKLSGSEWLLVAQNDGAVKSGPIHLDFGNVTDCTTTVSATGSVSAAPEEGVWCKVPDSVTDSYYSEFKGMYVTVVADNSGIDKDSENGQFLVKGLRDGTYYLKEYQAPDGYVKSEKTYTFTIEKDHYPTISEKTDGTPLSNNSITNTPYGGVSWSKVDSTDGMTVLSGSEWKLQSVGSDDNAQDITGADGKAITITDCTEAGKCSASQDNPYQDVDSAKDSFKLTYLPLGTYRLVETKAPTGYDLPVGTQVYYTFTIKEGDADKSYDRMNAKLYKADGVTEVTENKVPNDRTKGSVIWYKTDSTKDGYGDDARLKGSEWSLTQTKDWKGSDIATDKRTAIAVTDCISDDDTKCPTDPQNPTDRDGKAGEFQLKNLDWGTYELVETQAPAGFKKSETTYTFVIDKDHTGTVEIQIKGENGADVDGNIITNTPITVNSLPFTGTGSQTPRMFLPYVLGTVGAGLAVGLGLHVARRRMARQG
ncbi:SpaA isopeptide-forming pilin-related protein [Bifidobacterium dentium]|uniref:SpaA isopeptide-forming pilin-related protein n=1 Tax=Bifidobacterium dentium TaxID=1689 RepID=UPI001F509BC8|nr:SpaA isopeptide-forming pilin-related protein [Bifidobacterium dentium]